MTEFNDPISKVQWVHRSELEPNEYNPNHVPQQELELLQTSILEDGWTQPIVVHPDNWEIVDGEHRFMVSDPDPDEFDLVERDGETLAKYEGHVPIVELEISDEHQKMSTIRHNRARGRHSVTAVAEMVQSLKEAGLSDDEIMERLGMEREEVVRLGDVADLPNRVRREKLEISEGWEPDLQSQNKASK